MFKRIIKICRIRLSTLLLLVALVAVALAWFFDKKKPLGLNIVGAWGQAEHYYTDNVLIFADGTFERRVHRRQKSTFEGDEGEDAFIWYAGHYRIHEGGEFVDFVFEKRFTQGKWRDLAGEEKLHANCFTRCLVDESGCLLVLNLSFGWTNHYKHFESECLVPSQRYEPGFFIKDIVDHPDPFEPEQ